MIQPMIRTLPTREGEEGVLILNKKEHVRTRERDKRMQSEKGKWAHRY